ncbi:MAG TPA: sigma-70 family RNA polymerase sigma factor [Puia sp.]
MCNQTGHIQADKQLVDQVLLGDTKAFGVLIKNTEGLVAQIVFKLIPNAEDRKDIVQDVYMKAFHKLNEFKFQSRLLTWIGQITYNTCINWLEKKKLVLPGSLHEDHDDMEAPAEMLNNLSTTEQGSPTDGPVIQKELSGILRMAASRLPPVYQTLITLYHQEELSYADIVQITGLPEGTVKNYLFRARKMLKENLLANYKKGAL